MTYRRVIGLGLIAGLRYHDMQDMLPGEIMDYYVWRQKYDDVQHGIQREG